MAVACQCQRQGDGQGDRTPSAAASGAPASAGKEVVRLTAASAARHGLATEATVARVLRTHFSVPARVAFDAQTTVHVGTPLRGRVAELAVKLGATVHQGDLLLAIDSPELGEAQIAYLERRAALGAAAPAVQFGREDWERGKALFEESQGIPRAEVHRREAAYRTALAAQETASVACAAARSRLRILGMSEAAVQAFDESGDVRPRLPILAPASGQIVARDVTRGELVSPDDDALLTIADPGALWVLAAVPEARLGELRPGAAARVIAGATIHTGAVTFVAPTVDEATRTVEARIELQAPAPDLRPGMFVEVSIEHAAPANGDRDTLCVAEAAVQTVDRRTVVFVPVAGDEGAFEVRAVEVGGAVDGFVPVRHGLAPGDVVVTSGSFVLKAQATLGAGSDN
ncbi:MAG: efflux RND transporter periplasmic adaptor subunit [Planctomycetota bacterium]